MTKAGKAMSSIKRQMLSGVKWTVISTVIITVIQLIQFAFLANQLSVAEFGLVGIITTCTIFTQIFLDLGLGSAVIQKEGLSDRVLSTLYWLNVIAGGFLFLIMMLFSPIIADFFHREELTDLIRILALMYLIAPHGQQSQYLMQKELRFQELGTIEVISTAVSFVTLAILIFTINPVYAYVISQVVLYSLKGILISITYQRVWKPSFEFNLTECREVLAFGGYQLSSRLVNRLGSNMDVFLIGRYMGSEALGIYNLVYQIVTIPVLKINPILTKVAFPVFSKNQHSLSALNQGFLQMTKLLSIVTFPLLVGLTAVANVFITTFFGDKWVEAVPILQIMAIVGILRVLMNPNGSVILAKGKANIAFYWDLAVLILYSLTLYMAVGTKNLTIVAWTYAIVSIINFIIGRWLLSWLIELRWKAYMRTILLPLCLSLIMTGAAYLIKKSWIFYFPDNSIGALAISVSAGAVLYIMLIKMAYPQPFLLLVKKQKRGRHI